MSEKKIRTMHPEGKKGWNISKAKYDVVRTSMLDCLRKKELTFEDLAKCVGAALRGRFEGSIPWYTEVVKLDLEARNIIERTSRIKPELYRLKEVR